MKRPIPYKIGGQYKYPNLDRVFVLKSVREYIFQFACGHWCTDNVFVDLIDMSKGRQIYEMIPGQQLKLF